MKAEEALEKAPGALVSHVERSKRLFKIESEAPKTAGGLGRARSTRVVSFLHDVREPARGAAIRPSQLHAVVL